ncbi:MAG: glycoside hydrolase family 38 C-terminal domain-containing protein [Terracidiphilus sp.]
MNSSWKAHNYALLVLLFLGKLFFVAAPATAQDSSEMERAAALLPAQSRAVVERLTNLAQLPPGTWKMHVGDVTHGEAVNLDESGWQVMAPGTDAPTSAVWFRQTIQVPETLLGYDLTGARIWFQFHADANGPMAEFLYFNGRRVDMGESDLEPIVLFDNARPGDKAVVATQFFETVNAKHFRGATLRVDFPENRPNPEDLAQEFLSAALLLPSLAPGDSGKPGGAELATLNSAIGAVDVAALDAAETSSGEARAQAQARFDASLKAAQSRLETLRPLLQSATFHLTGNSHIDAAWLWPWTEAVDVVRRTFGTSLQLMNEYPTYTYTQSAAAYNEWMADKYPDLNAQIKKRIQEGRWEIVGGMWVEPDLNMPDGESLVRQLLVGKRWYKQAYGVDVRIGWNPDSFGYTWQLPQIYKKSGIDYFVTQKMTWSDTNQLPFKLFWWQSPDGSKVLTYFPHDYANDTLGPVRLSGDLAVARERAPGMTAMMDLYGVGDHGGGPTRVMLDQGFHWARGSQPPCLVTKHESPSAEANPGLATRQESSDAEAKEGLVKGHDFSRAESAPSSSGALAPAASCFVTPRYQFGTAQSFFSSIEKQIAPESPVWNYQSIAKGYEPPSAVPGKVAIPTWDTEMYLEYHRGVYTTQANHKKNMRDSEEEVLNAEKWASLAWLDGQSYPGAELTEDWKKVLFNQFHDLSAGSGIADIYKDAQQDYDWVRMSTDEISASALETVAERIGTLPDPKNWHGIPIAVFNSLGWERSGDVTFKIQWPDSGPGAFDVMEEHNSVIAPIPILAIRQDSEPGVVELTVSVPQVPAFGYEVLQVMGIPAGVSETMRPTTSVHETVNSFALANAALRVAVDKQSGCITSLSIARTNFETLQAGACGNQLQFFKDTPKQYDAWNIDPGTLDVQPMTIDRADSVELVGEKSNDAAIRITRHWQNSKFIQIISIPVGADYVDIDNDIDWHEKHILLKAAFPLAVTSNFATYEIPYGTIERSTTRNNSWEKAQFEVPAMRWADLSGQGPDGKVHGLSLLNQDKYGYDAVGNVLRLTLLRSPTWPDPDADQGHHHFHYAIYPHAGTWKDALTMRHGWEYDYPLQAVVTTAHPGSLPAEHSFASVGPENVVLTAVKKAEDANALIFRVYEWAGKETTAEFHVPPGATSATVTNLMEQPEGSPLAVTSENGGDLVKVPIHPYEILTIRVDYPTAGYRE